MRLAVLAFPLRVYHRLSFLSVATRIEIPKSPVNPSFSSQYTGRFHGTEKARDPPPLPEFTCLD